MNRYIDADAFIEENDGAENSGWTLKELINNFPTADVRENVHGEWVMVKGSNGKDYRKCTNCLHTQEITGLLNYCPTCGADMRTKEPDCDYERAIDQLEHDMLYEPTFNQDDGSM